MLELRELTELGLSPADLERLRGWLAAPAGVILVTGQRESGLTTTQYACARALLERGLRVSIAERTCEAELPGAERREAAPQRGRFLGETTRHACAVDAQATLVELIVDREVAEAIAEVASQRLVLVGLWAEDPRRAAERAREWLPEAPLLGGVHHTVSGGKRARCAYPA